MGKDFDKWKLEVPEQGLQRGVPESGREVVMQGKDYCAVGTA